MPLNHRFKFDKLIRDKMPDILRNMDGSVNKRVMEKDEYIKHLEGKFLELMRALIKVHDLTFAQVREIAAQKSTKMGGFDFQIYVDSIEVRADNSTIGYYRAQAGKDPEVV